MSNDPRNEISTDLILSLKQDVIKLSQQCSALVKDYCQARFDKELKSDQSFVTEVDFAVEDHIRNFVEKNYPLHGIVGEEREDRLPDADFQWITDPIDGTQNLVHGIPTFGTVIGVHYLNRPIVGALTHPLLDMSYYGAYKCGSFDSSAKKLQIQDGGLLPDGSLDPQEVIALSTRDCFYRSGEGEIFDQIMREHPSTRVYYDIFSTTRALAGQVGAVVEFNMKIWDIAATEVLITEAGGKFKLLRRVTRGGGLPDLVSIVAGKPQVVDYLFKLLGYKEFAL